MLLDYLCEFSVVARLGSFSQAAEELSISQSSLSKHMLALEKELNLILLNRTSRNVVVSEAGSAILPYANQVYEINKKMSCTITEQQNRDKRQIRIASIPVMAQYDITGKITQFRREYPQITISIVECEQSVISHMLESGECELAFLRKSSLEQPILEYIPFSNDLLVAVLPCSHYLSGKKAIHLDQLKSEEFLLLDNETTLYSFCRDLCIASGFTPMVSYMGHRPENIIDLVSKGMGISLLMRRHADYFKNKNVVSIDIEPTVESTVCLAKIKKHRLSPGAILFWNYIGAKQRL